MGPRHYHVWIWVFDRLQQLGSSEVIVDVIRGRQRDRFIVKTSEDRSWPLEDRGLILARDVRLVKPDGILQALVLGLRQIGQHLRQVVQYQRGLWLGQIGVRNLGGPVAISQAASRTVGTNSFFLLVGLLSLNFALINLLPIPILDGGDIILRIIEKLAGNPLLPSTRLVAYAIGLTLLLGWPLLGSLLGFLR